jgi:hypothetical protein
VHPLHRCSSLMAPPDPMSRIVARMPIGLAWPQPASHRNRPRTKLYPPAASSSAAAPCRQGRWRGVVCHSRFRSQERCGEQSPHAERKSGGRASHAWSPPCPPLGKYAATCPGGATKPRLSMARHARCPTCPPRPRSCRARPSLPHVARQPAGVGPEIDQRRHLKPGDLPSRYGSRCAMRRCSCKIGT